MFNYKTNTVNAETDEVKGENNVSYNVLVVDDTSFMRKMASDYLKQHGHTVIGEAVNGMDSIKKYQELKPELVLMDLNMPEMSGIEAIKEILKIDSEAAILVCSASNQQEEIFDALEAGAKGYLTKPFNSDNLKEAILKYAETQKNEQQETDSLDSLVSPEPNSHAEEAVSTNIELSDEEETPIITNEAAEETTNNIDHNHADKKEDVKVNQLTTNKEKRVNFVTSYMCRWNEKINDETTNYSVICSEDEDKILVEMNDSNHEKQVIQFTFDGFRQLNEWLESHLGNSAS